MSFGKTPIIGEFPPWIGPYNDCQLCGGRVHSISVNPWDKKEIIVAHELGGLWKTENGGENWFHLRSLLTVFAHDVAYAADGKTVICTLARDNRVENGGGIWLSPDGGSTWSKPFTADPPFHARVPIRMGAYGISWAPDNPRKVYVGTDFGVAISTDSGNTWSHHMLEYASPIDDDHMQNSVRSVLALPRDKAIVLCRTGIYQTDDGGTIWNVIRGGNFADIGSSGYLYFGFKNIDVSPVDSDYVFILRSYEWLLLYHMGSRINEWTEIPLPSAGAKPSRGPFVRVSKSVGRLDDGTGNSFDIWIGQAQMLLKATCDNIDDVRYLTIADWKKLWRPEGIHDDAGYLGLDKNKRPVLYGSDGGVFKPTNPEATKWTVAAGPNSGMNSFQIVDLGGTNVYDMDGSSVFKISLYFATQDNAIWGSQDGGISWDSWHQADWPEGFHISVIKNAKWDSVVTLAYGKVVDFPDSCMFSEANFVNKRHVPNVDTSVVPRPLDFPPTTLAQAFFISPKKWIRLRIPADNYREIYISQNNGENWRKKATIFEDSGVFAVAGPSSNPVIYVPIKGPRTTSGHRTIPDGTERIGLIRLTNVFDPIEVDYKDSDVIYLPDNGSLGRRATMFDWQAVYGVDPNDPNYIIAPDIHNENVKVSRNGGGSWTVDMKLTNEITKGGTFLLYDSHPSRMQVTRISFDPYNRNRILIGTRDAGIIVSEDHGSTWTTIPNSQELGMLYITNFFFRHDDTIIVSCYGRGLWETAYHLIPFPVDLYCKGDCGFIEVFDPVIIDEPPDWSDIDVAIFLNGRINGLVLTGNKVKRITVSPGTIYRRYTGNTINNSKLNIIESEQGEGFSELQGCLAVIQDGGIVKGIMLKENEVIGIISGKQEFTEVAIRPDNTSDDILKEPDSNQWAPNQPYLFITTSMPVMGTCILGNEGVIHIFATGFKFDPNAHNSVMTKIDEQLINQTINIIQDGTVRSQLKVPEDLSYGQHIVQVIQNVDDEEIKASSTFVKATIENFDENIQENE